MEVSPNNTSICSEEQEIVTEKTTEVGAGPVAPRQVPVDVVVTSPERQRPTETVFAPIKPAETCEPESILPQENEDSNSQQMSGEDIETMEILRNKDPEDSKNSWVDTPETGPQVGTPVSGSVNELSVNEDSVASSTTTTRNTDPIFRQGKMLSSIAASDLIEYQWPADGSGDYYMIQEQISNYIGITSFKRKYPEIERRKLDPQEVNHLMLNMLVSEVQLTLGLTAVRSRDVCDLMMREYPEKYQDYIQVLDEKRKESIKNKHLQYSNPAVEKSQMPNYIKKAMKQVSEFNARLNRQRKDDYSVYYDMQTNVLQIPKRKMKKVHPSYTKPSLYPCALIPGQFQEYCQKYTPEELNYFPINTVVYGPPPPPPPDNVESIPDSDSEKESQVSMDTETAEGEKTDKSQDEAEEVVGVVAKKETEINITVAEPVSGGNGQAEVKQEGLVSSATDATKDSEVTATGDTSLNKSEADQSKMSYTEDPDKPVCGICLKDETSNKKCEPEDLISCSQCDNYGHPSCLDMSKDLVSVIVTYNWQCLECKTCTYCSKPHHEDKMMFCDRCDRGYHTFCVGLRNLPSGLWVCPQCNRSDPDFAKKGGGGKRSSSGTPRKRKNSDTPSTPQPSADTPSKAKRKRRTKKEIEEAREKERLDKEQKRTEKKDDREERKKRRRQKKETGDDDSKEDDASETKGLSAQDQQQDEDPDPGKEDSKSADSDEKSATKDQESNVS